MRTAWAGEMPLISLSGHIWGPMSKTKKIIFAETEVRMRYLLIISAAPVAKNLHCTCKFPFNHVVYFV